MNDNCPYNGRCQRCPYLRITKYSLLCAMGFEEISELSWKMIRYILYESKIDKPDLDEYFTMPR